MLLYRFVRPLATLSFYALYRNIRLSNTDRIPKDKPVILAANHPTAFLETCILACFLDQQLYFLVRGNLFEKPVYNALLRGLNLLPIFRLVDGGYSKVKTNYSTFSACFDSLAAHRILMILAEGRTTQQKGLGPLQKGTARIALGAMDSVGLEEVYVVPVGVNFTYADKPRSEVMIDFGVPLRASDYIAAYKENQNQGMAKMTDALRESLLKHLVVIEKPEDDLLVDQLLQIVRTDQGRNAPPVVTKGFEPLQLEMETAAYVNALPASQKERLRKDTATYFERLQQFGLDDKALAGKPFNTLSTLLILLLGFPFQLIGRIWSYPPVFLGKYISATQVKRREFKLPVQWGVSLGAYLVYLILWLIIAAFVGGWKLILIVAGLLISGYFSLYYQELRQRYKKSKRLGELPASQVEMLKEKRGGLVGQLSFGK